MAEANGPAQLAQFLRRLSTRQRISLGAVVVGGVVMLIFLVSVLNRPSYGTLFSNLSEQDASKIVEKLKEKSIPYVLEDGGKTIQVPRQQIYDLRLSFAGEGLPQSSVIGYEIFDRTNLGVSDFVQKINYRRALEGELARTILQLEEVEGARVHIVVPERALFKEDEKPATASVVLKLRSGLPLRRENIQGIQHLVASSVEGLESSNVSIIDSRGVLLSENARPNSLASLTSTQYELQQKVDAYLGQKAQSLLDGVMGQGNALVQVNADLDFRQVERTLEEYDPEKTAVRSEQVTEEKNTVSDTLPPSTRNSSVTNYEVNKTLEHIVESVGAIRRLSIAAMVNDRQHQVTKDGQTTTEYTPRKPEEMNQLTDIVKRAVGYTSTRGDEISVVNMQFGTSYQDGDFMTKETPFSNWYDIAEKVFLVLAMGATILIIRSLLNRVRVQMAGAPSAEAVYDGNPETLPPRRPGVQLPSPEDEISEEAQLREQKRKRISEYMSNKPEDAARLLKVWLAEN